MSALHQQNWPELGDEILTILRCISCKSKLRREADGFVCVECGRQYPQVKRVVRFVDAEHYAGSFGFQWHAFRQTQLDNEESRRSEKDFRRRTGFEPEDLAGKLVLDVGCGMGRFAEIATRWGARVVGIDLSVAAEVAGENLKEKARQAVFFQADVFQLPFAPESFDYIYSLGVLHHTPDCKAAFEALPRLLKPGGRIAIWLYSRYHNWYRMSDVYRKVTRRMSPRLLHRLCYGVVPLYGVHRVLKKIPLVGHAASGALAYAIPMSFNPDPKWRVLDTFDWYSPWYQSKHTYEEVFRWFESCGLENLRVVEQPIAVQGQKPLTARLKENHGHPEDDGAASRCEGEILV
jgi:2-polyprenyl-3-methyl-5-hydroxy-6-metoxy-1,4-benzoquinol methylase